MMLPPIPSLYRLPPPSFPSFFPYSISSAIARNRRLNLHGGCWRQVLPSRNVAVICMANQRRVKMVAKQIRRELSDMLLTDKVIKYAVLPEASLGADRYLSSLTTISDVVVSGDLQEQLGAVSVIASLPNPSVKLELSSSVPSNGLPRAALQFPYGEIALEQRENVEEKIEGKKALSVDGILKSPMLNGICTVVYNGNDLNLRYIYKDTKLSFVPCINLPSNKVSFAFKRQFNPSDKFSYWYHFDSSAWSAVYKHTIGKDLKIKVGYDSEVHLGWASLWVGSEDGKTKDAPRKLKAQMMLQVPQDGIKSSALMFRVKKRWDL